MVVHWLRKKQDYLEGQERFVSDVSHELRTPLNGIIGHVKDLRSIGLNDNQISSIEIIEHCADNMMKLINNILDFSKLEAGKYLLDERECQFSKFVDHIVATHIKTIDENCHEVTYVSGKDSTTIVGKNVIVAPGRTGAKWIQEYSTKHNIPYLSQSIEIGVRVEVRKEIMESIYAKGRDNGRTPMQWDNSENAGFTTGTPWLAINENYNEINAKQCLEDENSIFHHYRKLINIRKKNTMLLLNIYFFYF